MVNDHSKFQHSMNSALDHALTEEELDALKAQMSGEPEAADYWERLRKVDHLIKTTPAVSPSAGFSGRVMAALAAMNVPADRRWGVGIALGLAVAAFLTLPIFSALLILLVTSITDPGMLNALLQMAATGGSYVIDLTADFVRNLQTVTTDTPALPALLSTMIPLSMLWVWLVWYLSGGSKFLSQQEAA